MEDGKSESATRRGFARWKTTAFITRLVAKKPRQGVLLAGACVRLSALGRAMRAAKFAQTHTFVRINIGTRMFVLWTVATADACTSVTERSLWWRNWRAHFARVEVVAIAPLERAGGMQHRWGRDRDRCSNLHRFFK